MAKRKNKTGLGRYAEKFAISLLYEATNGKIGKSPTSAIVSDETEVNPISFRDRAKLLDSITKLLSAQDPPDDDDEDGVTEFRERLKNGGTSERGADNSEDDDIV